MNQNRKYFGMTTPQLGILGGLAGALCLILCVAGYLIFGGGLNPASPQLPPTIEPTPTLNVTPTPTFTPEPTLIPYVQLVPAGWTQHQTSLIEFWMPAVFKDAKLKVPKGAVWVAKPEMVLTLPASKTNTFALSVVISSEPLTGDTLKSFVDQKIQSLPASARLVDRGVQSLNPQEAIRLVFETRVDNVDVNQMVYVIQDGSTVWYVLYITQINEFYENIEIFNDSIRTFRLVN